MARRKRTDKQEHALWTTYKDNHLAGSPVDLRETERVRQARKTRLEKHPEEWFQYYLSKYYQSEPAPFHTKATRRIVKHSEWYEVRSWSRELAKSTRTMMEVLYLVLTGAKHNVLLVSYSYDNAEELLSPYKHELESNRRILQDYGLQVRLGEWESKKFKTRMGASFRALGKGQSPRGTRNNEIRPDVILIDDIDTDEECRNPERIKESVQWIEKALIPTRSVSGDLLILACGNIIASYCCITEMAKKADHHDIINIRDKQGKSTWPQKNSEEDIDRVLSQISHNSARQEYFNDPVVEGNTFKEITFGPCPKLTSCDSVVIYADPATSNKDKSNASAKAVGILGKKGSTYYVYKVWLDQMNNSSFVDYLFKAHQTTIAKGIDTCKVYMENNSLQNPFYEQVLLPMIRSKSLAADVSLPITEDRRKKSEKYTRIDGTLEPKNRLGDLIFNSKEENDPHMERLKSQMLGVSPKAKQMDGPDMIEGGVWILEHRQGHYAHTHIVPDAPSRKY